LNLPGIPAEVVRDLQENARFAGARPAVEQEDVCLKIIFQSSLSNPSAARSCGAEST